MYAYFGASILDFKIPEPFLIFVFSSTLFTYNFQRLIKFYSKTIAPISGPRAEWVKRYRFIVYLTTGAGALAALYFGWAFLLEAYWLLIIAGFFSLFYVLRLPFIGLNIRSLPHIKIYVLGLTWVLVTHVLPYTLFSNSPINIQTCLFFLGSFLFVFSISIPFDIRDLQLDNHQMKTIPQVFGVISAKRLAIGSVMVSTTLFYIVVENFHLGILLNMILTIIGIYNSGNYKYELTYSGLIDGLFIGLSLLWFLFK